MATSRSTPVFEIFQDKKGEYRWRARAKNGNLLAAASEGYKDKRDAVHCAKLFGYDPKAVPPAPKAVKTVAAAPKKGKTALAAEPAAATPEAAAAPATKPKRPAKPKVAPAPAPESLPEQT